MKAASLQLLLHEWDSSHTIVLLLCSSPRCWFYAQHLVVFPHVPVAIAYIQNFPQYNDGPDTIIHNVLEGPLKKP